MHYSKGIIIAGTIPCLFSSLWLHSLPQDIHISEGEVQISSDRDSMTIHASDKSILEYSSFSIGAQERVTFVQPSHKAVVLNRVVGEDPSQIFGALQSNGRVFLVNPNGVYFGPDSKVDVGAIVASTLDIADADYRNGVYSFSGNGEAEIISEGLIVAEEGAILIAPHMEHTGSIISEGGDVSLLSGEKVEVYFSGEGLLGYVVSSAMKDVLTAQMDGNIDTRDLILREVINTEGIQEAVALVKRGEEYILTSSPSGSITITGTIDTSSSAESGGDITLMARDISLLGAAIDASGESGGEIVIGGIPSLMGEMTSGLTHVDENTTIISDSWGDGDAGTITLWSSGDTVFDGFIGSRAFSEGKGGFVETSARRGIGIKKGLVDTSSRDGSVGEWLIDPDTIIVMTGGMGTLVSAALCSDTSSSLTVDPAVIALSPTTVTLCALGSSGGTITVVDNITMSLLNNTALILRVQDNGSIFLGANISTNGAALTLQGPVILTNNVTLDATGGGITPAGSAIMCTNTVNSDLPTSNRTFTVTAGTAGQLYLQGTAGATNPLGSVSLTAGDAIVYAGALATGGGAITVTGPSILEGDMILDTTAGGTSPSGANISFSGSTSTIDGGFKCRLDAGTMGVITLDGVVGGAVPLTSFNTKGSGTTVGNNINASGNTVIFESPVTLANDVTITDFGTSGVFFRSTVQSDGALSPRSLAIDALLGSTYFLDDVGGGGLPLGNVTVSSNYVEQAGDVTLAVNDSLSYTGFSQILINGDITTSGMGNVTLNNPATFGEVSTITFGAGTTTINGLLGVGNLTVTGAGTVNFVAPTAEIGTIQVTAGTVNVPALSPIHATGGISLNAATSTINGNLHVVSGDITLAGTTLTLDNYLTSETGNILISAATPSIGGKVTLGNGTFTVNNDVVLVDDLTLLAQQGGADFQGAVDGNFSLSAQCSAAGFLQFEQLVGGVTPLSGVDVSAGNYVQASNILAGGDVTISSNAGEISGSIITTSNKIALKGVFETKSDIVLDTTAVGTSAGADILLSGVTNTIYNKLIGLKDLILKAGAGRIRIDASVSGVGGQNPGTSLAINNIDAQSGQSIALSGKIVSGNQIRFRQPILLNNDTELHSTSVAANAIQLDATATINGNHDLVLNCQGGVVINDIIGGSDPLRSLTINAAGTIINTTLINTKGGSQLYNTPIVLENDLTMRGSGGNILLADFVNSAIMQNRALTIEVAGASATLEGNIGGGIALSTLSVKAPTISLSNDITTITSVQLGASGQGYLQRDLTITSPSITIDCDMNNAYDLTLSGGIVPGVGTIAINGAVGDLSPLQLLTVSNGATLTTNEITARGLAVSGVTNSTFNGLITTHDVEGISLSGTNFTFTSDISSTGGGGLTTTHTGTLSFAPFTSLTLAAGFLQTGLGAVSLGANIYTNSADAIFSGPTTLTDTVTVDTGLGSGNLFFGGTLNGLFALAVNTSLGNVTFAGAVGGVTQLGNILIYQANQVTALSSILCQGFVQESGFDITSFSSSLTTNGRLGINITNQHINNTGSLITTNMGNIILNSIIGSIGTAGSPLTISDSGSLYVGAYCSAYFQGTVAGRICPVRSNPSSYTYLNGSLVDYSVTCVCDEPNPPPPPPSPDDDVPSPIAGIPSRYLLAQGMTSHDCTFRKDSLMCRWYFVEPHIQDYWFTKGNYVYTSSPKSVSVERTSLFTGGKAKTSVQKEPSTRRRSLWHPFYQPQIMDREVNRKV